MGKEYYMNLAISEARKSLESLDVPVGAIIVKDGVVVASAHNERERRARTVAHAEILAIEKANKKLQSSRLDGADIYITKEPCLMCMGAILSAHIHKIYFGAYDKRFGTMDLAVKNNFNYQCEIEGGICEGECSQMLVDFFKKLRVKND